MVTTRIVEDQQAGIREQATQILIGQAATMAETVGHELQLIDQSLTIIQASWKSDSDSVDLVKLQEKMPALTGVADDLFIADDKHIIRQDILPQAIGQGIGSAYVTFPHGSLEKYLSNGTKEKAGITEKASFFLQGDTGGPVEARQFLMYIVRPLDHPKGWLLGASYRSNELTKLFAQAGLGYNSMVALVDTQRGIVQAVVGVAARRPTTDVAQSPLFAVLARSPTGTWIGANAVDGVERLHAFHRVVDRDMSVVVAASLAEVMLPADSLADSARGVASAATVLVLAIGALVLWELYTVRAHRGQKRVMDRNRSELERLRMGEPANTARANLNAARLQAVMDHTADGIALLDSNLRLTQWNHAFTRGIGIEPRAEMPLDMLLRGQIATGLFGALQDAETEVLRRIGVLCAGDPAGLRQPGPEGDTLTLRGVSTGDGGFILMLAGFSGWEAAPQPAISMEIDQLAALTVIVPIEW